MRNVVLTAPAFLANQTTDGGLLDLEYGERKGNLVTLVLRLDFCLKICFLNMVIALNELL